MNEGYEELNEGKEGENRIKLKKGRNAGSKGGRGVR